MIVFRGTDNLPRFDNPVVTMGSYDGVHCGHRELLGTVMRTARDMSGTSVVVTFDPHPRFLTSENEPVKLLTTTDEKIRLLEAAGIDVLIIIPFTREFLGISPYDFVRDYLRERIGVSTLVVGYNHHFGHDKEGNYDYLCRIRQEFGFDVIMVPRKDMCSEKVSSTVIRGLLAEGRMKQAAKLLGYDYFMILRKDDGGLLHTGDPAKLLPVQGRYDVRAESGGISFDSILTVSQDGLIELDGSECLPADMYITVTFC